MAAFAYLAQSNSIQRDLVPFDWYKAFVVDGAHEHGLPVEYVAGLEAQPSKMDSNESRRDRANEVLKTTDL